ncbi:hypothetical protein [Amycolatopsis dendrobii]|uniref:Uncharacterized protein n=1 Tax=Amycolatopsis dendrobii TaxID=2760662 RepID=A0A7W3W2R7_9PSEU|nr:hypothetical protein [Amycolatopsis dendrobii]MBB1157683.1 hypothetical protein [Amycolatopsis dendrobii]
MIPPRQELHGLGFRDLAARLEAARITERPQAEPADQDAYYYDWYLAVRWFKEKFVETCRELTEAEWPRYAKLADNLLWAAKEFSDLDRTQLVYDRFHLSSALLRRVPPRSDIPLLNPAQLLKGYLSELSISPEEAKEMKSRRDLLNKVDERKLWETRWLMSQIKFVDHLFSESPELDEYRKWKDVWPEPPI